MIKNWYQKHEFGAGSAIYKSWISTILKTIIVPSQMGVGTSHKPGAKEFSRKFTKLRIWGKAPLPSAKRQSWHFEKLMASETSTAP